MELKISGLKCDTKHCNYRDDSVKFKDYVNTIGRKCPVCKSNLLTQKDYENCVKLYNRVDTINYIADVLKWINPFYYISLLFGSKDDATLSIKYENDGTATKIITKGDKKSKTK